MQTLNRCVMLLYSDLVACFHMTKVCCPFSPVQVTGILKCLSSVKLGTVLFHPSSTLMDGEEHCAMSCSCNGSRLKYSTIIINSKQIEYRLKYPSPIIYPPLYQPFFQCVDTLCCHTKGFVSNLMHDRFIHWTVTEPGLRRHFFRCFSPFRNGH